MNLMESDQWRIQDFPLRGALTHWGGASLQHIHFSAKTYAKMKGIDPVGGVRAGSAPLDPPMLIMFLNHDSKQSAKLLIIRLLES